MNRFGCSVFVVLLCCGSLQAQSWARFRGDGGSGVSVEDSADAIPTSWSDSSQLAWKTELPGAGSSSAVVRDDQVFLTAYSGYGMSIESPGQRDQLRLHVICLDLGTGELLWDREFEAAAEEQAISKRVVDHGYASPTPCVDADNVYASFGPSGVVALTRGGEFLWRQSVGTGTAGFGAAASPIEFENLVIMNASIEGETVYGLDKSTGAVIWKTGEIAKAWTTPTIVRLGNGSVELVLNQKDAICGFDPRTGQKLWWCDGIPDYIVPVVIADGEMLYCSGGRSNMTFAVRAGGRGDVSESHLVWDVNRGANVTSPLLHDGYLYWSHDKALAVCVRASDGEEMFRERLPTRGRVYGSIVSDGKHLFLTTRDEGVLVLKAQPTYEEVAVNKLGSDDERFNATPAIVGGRLLLRSNRAIYCVAAAQ